MTYTGNVINELYDLVERAQRFEGVPEVKVLRNTPIGLSAHDLSGIPSLEPQVGVGDGKPAPALTEAHWARFLQKDGPDPEPEED